jgi:HEPN domain-containing protein
LRLEYEKLPIGHRFRVIDTSIIESVDLTDADQNAGHITVLFGIENFLITLDTRFNAGDAWRLAKKANSFLATAILALDHDHLDPAIDNAFSAAELVSKAELVAFNRQVLSAKKHGFIRSEMNRLGKTGTISRRFVEAYNGLERARPSARYGEGRHRIIDERCREYIDDVHKTLRWFEARLPNRPNLKPPKSSKG